MERTSGSSEVKIGLIDGPVVTEHPDLASEQVYEISKNCAAKCAQADSAACLHGTFIAGILCARRGSPAPAICPDCTLLIRPIFTETIIDRDHSPGATPQELAAAIIECIDRGARVLNLSLALAQPSVKGERELEEALDWALKRGVIVVAAAGNQGALGSSAITRHPWVIPVVACDLAGRTMKDSNLCSSIGRWGLSAPGEGVTSLGAEGHPLTLSGTSVAAPFVTGVVALLWSEFPTATAAEIKRSVARGTARRRISLIPPLLDAMTAFQAMMLANVERRGA